MIQIAYSSPTFSLTEACQLAHDHYGLSVMAQALPGERDRNFLLTDIAGRAYVLKIAQLAEQRSPLELQHRVLTRLTERVPTLRFPQVIVTRSGEMIANVQSSSGDTHLMRLLTYVPGRVWARVTPHTSALLHSLGQALGLVDVALQDFPPPPATDFKWDLSQAAWIQDYLGYHSSEHRSIVERLFEPFLTRVAPRLAHMRAGLLYNDANDYNLLVENERVSGLIDYGDLTHGAFVCELAIGLAYALLHQPDPLTAAAQVVSGYHSALPLTEEEVATLYPLLLARLCVSVTNAAYQHQQTPENAYLQISAQPAWELLESLAPISFDLAHYTLRQACGWSAHPATPALTTWLKDHAEQFKPVVPAEVATESVVFDLSVGSTAFGTLEAMRDAEHLTRQIFDHLRTTGARVGIGRYREARLIYSNELFEGQGNDGPERRTLHLGLDLFMEAGTPVCAPLAGVVHSCADNVGEQDYGPTLILEHRVEGDLTFFTLYGHLSRASLAEVAPGKAIAAGERIGWIGERAVNGNWPPHLHFQIVLDLMGHVGEFPGVGLARQRDFWCALCPDPNLIVRVPAEKFPPEPRTTPSLLHERRERLGPNLSLAYRQPLHIVRGFRQYLYDVTGRAYLDAVNNVPHVGHCHPQVVRAGQAQMATLNTNSRYLHDLVVRYAERLCATLPDPLRVCYFVNSGSEANELALRLARTYTQRRGVVVLDQAYHGNTQTLVSISPYKYDSPGGAGEPVFARKIPMPDTYRGEFRSDDPQAGVKYARYVIDAIDTLAARGENLSAFIAESIMGSSGQIILPEGFLREAYHHARAAGGVCIADEVQVGFGRIGSHFWAFEPHGVVPDIVALGKPMGNGHPLGAVITTPAIAQAFNNGMEYFSTFGGNPVSAAIGLAVLDVIEAEGLQANAAQVGGYLLNGFRRLAETHALIGDVRGQGLFMGVEFVTDRANLTPAPAQTAYIANRLKERGVLVSIDGPLHNVLKIKPPLVFTQRDADFFVETLGVILREDAAQIGN